MQKALTKKTVDSEHIKTCLSETFRLRRKTYLHPPDGKGETTVKRMFTDFPALERFEFVRTFHKNFLRRNCLVVN